MSGGRGLPGRWPLHFRDVMRSERSVALRPLREEDAGVLAGWAADPEFCRQAGWTVGLPFSEVQRFHQRLIEAPPPDLIRLGAISVSTLVGYVDLHGEEPHRREL